jgi:hypothetical protein
MAKYAPTPLTTTTFPKVGSDEPDLVNVSGAPSPSTLAVHRAATTEDASLGGPKSNRRPIMINAQSGESLGMRLEGSLSRAAQQRLQIRQAVERADPSLHHYFAHIFGLNLPPRGRA